MDIVNKIGEADRTIEKLKKDFTDKSKILEEVLPSYMGENDLKILKPGFHDLCKYLTRKFAYPYEYFNSVDDYQKPFDNL